MSKLDLANCLRFLSIDAVERANSGHPGMPMGMADVATILFTEFLKFDAKNPKWLNRDRFVLSAGHGSMLIYSLLHLTGYEDVTIEDLKNFRQLGAKCAGHPEHGHLAGIETTTGPLGQGIATAVGFAIAERMAEANHKTYALVGDGCLMEGISQEAISLAGHLNLSKLVVLWDNNSISIDGETSLTTSENMKMRFESCGFDVIQIDGHNFDEIRAALQKAQSATRPTLIDCKTTIGFGSPAKAGTEKCHGSPLGAEEVKKTREALGWNHEPFFIPENLRNEWLKAGTRSKSSDSLPPVERSRNQETFDSIPPVERSRNQVTFDPIPPVERSRNQVTFDFPKSKQATRKSSQQVLEFLTGNLPNLVGGSADLTGSVLTKTSHTKPINKDDFSGRYIHYGVREHAMGAIMNGIALHSNFIPYGGTFLVFADYMKPAIRLAALMQQQLIYIFTHDSIGLGEDGPTHQAIEHLAMLRGIPNLNVFRPADSEETWQCFEMALAAKKTPSAMILTRQDLPFLVKEKSHEGKGHEGENLANRGGYALNNVANPEVVIIATGSEVSIAVEAKEKLQAKGVNARVVSMPCFEIFEEQDEAYKNEVLGAKNILRVGVEAAISQGWEKYLGFDGIFVGMKSFGASGKAEDLYRHFGITAEAICEQVVKKLRG